MSEAFDENQNSTDETATNEFDELTILKQRAEVLGLKVHPKIGVDKLKAKIELAMNGEADKEDAPEVTEKVTPIIREKSQADLEREHRMRLVHKANKLMRLRVTCMNPNKKEHSGEVFTVSNRFVGTIKKFVLFEADEGWHVPWMIYQMMLERKCQIFVNAKGSRGQKIKKSKIIREFAIEILPDLTVKELETLSKQQAMAKAAE